jgi:tRNA pseudouridine13 synthase
MIIKKHPEDFIVEEIPAFDLKDNGQYGIYKMTKKSLNTEEAISIIVRRFGIDRRKIKYAGTKDRNAVTMQYISIQDKRQFNGKEENLELRYIGRSEDPLSLGTLQGNRFEIIARELSNAEMTTFTSHKQDQVQNIPNYFDEQRFSKHNFEIGLSILKGKFNEGAQLLVQSTNNKEFHEHIQKNPKDLIGAIRRLPTKILSMYIHSVQSYIFNEALSRKLKESDCYAVKYSLGTFIFPLEESEFLSSAPPIPLVGFDYDQSNIDVNKIMQELDLVPKNFIIRSIPELSAETSMRNAFTTVSDFSSETIDDQTIKLRFSLQKGSYATIVVKGLLSSRR